MTDDDYEVQAACMSEFVFEGDRYGTFCELKFETMWLFLGLS